MLNSNANVVELNLDEDFGDFKDGDGVPSAEGPCTGSALMLAGQSTGSPCTSGAWIFAGLFDFLFFVDSDLDGSSTLDFFE